MLWRTHEPGMPGRTGATPIDYDGLAEFLSALAYPARLELLHILRFPHTAGEIRLGARRGHAGDADEAPPSSRPSVLGHIDKLEEVGLVRSEPAERGGRSVRMFQANTLKLYAVLEDLRTVATLHAGHGPAGEATGTLDRAPSAGRMTGPRLVLVHGLYEGRAYPLQAKPGERAWTIGRRKGLAVSLDYDPYVSLENAVITQQGARFTVTDLKESKNGTAVNWEPLPRGGSHALRAGDVVGVGRSLLSFVPE